MPLWSIASLVLIESGAARPERYLPALVRLLGEEPWARDERGTLCDRAERLLRELYASDTKPEAITRSLEAALEFEAEDDHRSDRVACAAAKLLISLNAGRRAGVARVLVERGLRHQYRHEEVGEDLAALLRDEAHRDETLKALIGGLDSGNKDTRRGCARILRRSDAAIPPLALLVLDDESEEGARDRLHKLLSDPSQMQSTLIALAEGLWDDDATVAWRAASALFEHGAVTTPGLAQALIRTGLTSDSRRPTAAEYLEKLRSEPGLDLAVRGALFDGLRSSDKKAAAASGLFLIGIGEARGEERVARIATAILRDPAQVKERFDESIGFLAKTSLPAIVRAVGEYFASKDLDANVVAKCGNLVVQSERFDTPHLARALVLVGLADKSNQKQTASHLERLLEDTKLVAETRKALSDGLSSSTSDVAWGCARCLWEAGGRTDPGLANAIARMGLVDSTRREVAKSWLVELLANPRTARKATAAVDEVASAALSRYRGGQVDYDHAWEIARCVLAAGLSQSETLVKALVVGGFGRRERHDEAVRTINALAASPGSVATQIEEELWSAVALSSTNSYDQSENAVRWGAARCLVETDRPSVLEVLSSDADEVDERAVALLKTLLREASEQTLASSALQSYLDSPNSMTRVRKVLADLLRDEDSAIAHAASCLLLGVGETHHRDLPMALIRRGSGWYDRKEGATRMLDELRARPLVGVAVMEALQQALWGADQQQAWSAAVYLMDGGDSTTPGLARAIAFAGFGDHGSDDDAEIRLRTLLENPVSRPSALDALRSALLRGRSGHNHNVAALLVLAGEPLHKQILSEFDSEHVARTWPLGPLSALALSGRVQEARDGAGALGFSRLAHLLAEDEEPALT